MKEVPVIPPIEKPKKKRKAKSKSTAFYVAPADFLADITDYYKTDIISDRLAQSINKIVEGLSYAPNFVNYCVDEKTEALTQRGWLKYNEIQLSDKILSYNISNEQLTWSKIKNIYIDHYKGLMFSLTVKGLDALVTPNHKFVCKDEGLKSVEYIRACDRVIFTGKPVTDSKPIYTDDFVEIVGWAVTEGHYKLGKTKHALNIFQKIGPKADRIRNCLIRLNAHFKEYKWTDPSIIGFCVSKQIANDIISVSSKRILSMEFILSLTQSQRLKLIQTMIDGDGWTSSRKTKDNLRGYCQKCEKHTDNFIALCTIAGLTTSKTFVKHTSIFGYSEYFVVNIFGKSKISCRAEGIDFHGARSGPGGDQIRSDLIGKERNPNKPTIKYEGIIWCPETEYGTFVCRRGKYVYVTGNSYKPDMVGDARVKMVAALMHKKFKINSGFNPFSYFTTIAFHAFINRIKKEKKHHQTIQDYQEQVYDNLLNSGEGKNNIYVDPYNGHESDD